MADDFRYRDRRDKAKIRRAGRGVLLDFLRTKGKRFPSVAERRNFHAQGLGIERRRGVDIPDGQNHVIKAVDFHEWRFLCLAVL